MYKKVLSFGAHPDDIEIGCGGTECNLIQKGYEVYHVYVTSGEAGSQTLTKDEQKIIRENEAINAAKILKVKEVEFLRYPDGLTEFTFEMRIKIINIIRKIRPEIIFVHGASDLFPDHKIVHNLVMSAIQGAAGPWFQDSIGEPFSPLKIYGFEVWHPITQYQLAVKIDNSLNTKLESIRAYKSQVGPTKYDEAFKGLARYRGIMSWTGQYAEVFEILKSNM